jgi:hypothetical protein
MNSTDSRASRTIVSGAKQPSIGSRYSRHSRASTILNQPIVPFPQAMGRDFAFGVADALYDRELLKPTSKTNGLGTVTLKPNYQKYNAPKEPGQEDLYKRNCEQHDKWDKVHFDYYGRKIVKLHDDERHYHKNTMAEHFYHEFAPNRKRQTLNHPLFRGKPSVDWATLQPNTTKNSAV